MVQKWRRIHFVVIAMCLLLCGIILSKIANYSMTRYLNKDIFSSHKLQKTQKMLKTVSKIIKNGEVTNIQMSNMRDDYLIQEKRDTTEKHVASTIPHSLLLKVQSLENVVQTMKNDYSNKVQKLLSSVAELKAEKISHKFVYVNSNKTKHLYDIKNPFWLGKDHVNDNYSLLYQKKDGSNHQTVLVTTTKCKVEYKVIVLITSQLSHFNRRHTIRNTYGTDRSGHRWKTFFVVGRSVDRNKLKLLQEEIQTHGDIILVDVNESFYKLTAKLTSGFEWAVKYCQFQYLLKGDDDIFINMATTFNFLDGLEDNAKTELYIGNVQFQATVFRNGRYGIAKNEFRANIYPRYCSGGGFLLSHDVASTMVNLFSSVPFIIIDDAYIGIVALKGGIDPIHNGIFRFYEDEKKCDYNSELIVHHPVKSQECMEKLFKASIK